MKTAAVAMLVMALALAGCKDKPPDDGAGTTARAASAVRGTASDAVAAVLMSTGTPVAKLSYVVESRPVQGVPFTVSLLASAATSIPALEMAVSSPTLEIEPVTGTLALEADKPATHELTLTSAEEGLTEFTVRLKADGGAEAVYAIPVLVMAQGAAGGEGGG
ncbi:MAG: hypothetical protein M3Y79_13215 [Pseudomonadota bacterium]|nr:hypothetical protein [Pseudomonadota bacterium]